MSDPARRARHWAPALPPGRLVDLPGRGPLYVRELPGPPGAPVLVLLHGWTVTSDLTWFPSFAALGERFRVVAFDNRGHGRGLHTHGPFRLEACADDAVAVADALGIDRFVPVGYSLGGPIALLTWRRHRARVDGLVLGATALRFHGGGRDTLRFHAFPPLAGLTRVLPARWRRPLFDRVVRSQTREADLAPWIVDEIRSGHPRLVLSAGWAIRRFDARAWAPEVDVPTGVVVIDGDGVVPTPRQEALAAAIAGARLWRVEGAHDVCVRHPRRFLPALVEACAFASGGRAARR